MPFSTKSFIGYNMAPGWTTTAGAIGTFTEDEGSSVSVTAFDPDGGIITYSVASGSIPTGMSLNASNGAITGTPTSADEFSFTIRATDPQGKFTDRAFSITVEAAVGGGVDDANVMLLAHMDNTNADATGRHTGSGGSFSASDQKYGTHWHSSGAITYTDSLSDFAFSGEFTIELWIKILGTSNQYLILASGYTRPGIDLWIGATAGWGGTYGYFDILTNLTMTNLVGGVANYAPNYYFGRLPTLQADAVVTVGTWFHCAITRDASNVMRLFKDGIKIGQADWSGDLVAPASSLAINPGVDDLRIIKGQCIYTENFTPPAGPHEYTAP